MKLRLDGHAPPRRLRRRLQNGVFALRDRLSFDIVTGREALRFHATTKLDLQRAALFESKEPGTVAWLRDAVRAGDRVVDIGANIGLYAILAGRLGADVWAFEPHVDNFASLLRNIGANGLIGKVRPLCLALGDSEGLTPFYYERLGSADSGSQLGRTETDHGGSFTPAAIETKYAISLDALVSRGQLPPPQLVKIDVDGNESQILNGMRGLLAGLSRPRDVQVEVSPTRAADIVGYMASLDYAERLRHYTASGQKRIAAGQPAEKQHANVVFSPRL